MKKLESTVNIEQGWSKEALGKFPIFWGVCNTSKNLLYASYQYITDTIIIYMMCGTNRKKTGFL